MWAGLLGDLNVPERGDRCTPCSTELFLLVAIEKTKVRCIFRGDQKRNGFLATMLDACKQVRRSDDLHSTVPQCSGNCCGRTCSLSRISTTPQVLQASARAFAPSFAPRFSAPLSQRPEQRPHPECQEMLVEAQRTWLCQTNPTPDPSILACRPTPAMAAEEE